ncbi:hypothetical protein B0H19DRAFT_578120 [Mycena capillaripes]|nr:hypothetical protein B0H19DRAFT_578120 [Mycena capillaripes]
MLTAQTTAAHHFSCSPRRIALLFGFPVHTRYPLPRCPSVRVLTLLHPQPIPVFRLSWQHRPSISLTLVTRPRFYSPICFLGRHSPPFIMISCYPPRGMLRRSLDRPSLHSNRAKPSTIPRYGHTGMILCPAFSQRRLDPLPRVREQDIFTMAMASISSCQRLVMSTQARHFRPLRLPAFPMTTVGPLTGGHPAADVRSRQRRRVSMTTL